MGLEKKAIAKKPARKGALPAGPPHVADGATGDALRRAYDEAVKESIPDEMLDLLDKLS